MPNHVFIWLCIIILFVTSCTERQEGRLVPMDQLVEGDLAFRCGLGFFSRAVTVAEDDGLYSHVGLVVRENGEWMVVHAVPAEHDFKGDSDRVKMDGIEVFFRNDRARRGCLVHTGLTDSAQVRRICRRAIELAHDSVLFDNDYDLEDSTRFYCSELVWHLYNKTGMDISEGRRRFIDIFHIKGDVILPEHLFRYSGNAAYFSF